MRANQGLFRQKAGGQSGWDICDGNLDGRRRKTKLRTGRPRDDIVYTWANRHWGITNQNFKSENRRFLIHITAERALEMCFWGYFNFWNPFEKPTTGQMHPEILKLRQTAQKKCCLDFLFDHILGSSASFKDVQMLPLALCAGRIPLTKQERLMLYWASRALVAEASFDVSLAEKSYSDEIWWPFDWASTSDLPSLGPW